MRTIYLHKKTTTMVRQKRRNFYTFGLQLHDVFQNYVFRAEFARRIIFKLFHSLFVEKHVQIKKEQILSHSYLWFRETLDGREFLINDQNCGHDMDRNKTNQQYSESVSMLRAIVTESDGKIIFLLNGDMLDYDIFLSFAAIIKGTRTSCKWQETH